MIHIPDEVVHAAAQAASLHYDICPIGAANGCGPCRVEHSRAAFILRTALNAFPDEVIDAIQQGRPDPADTKTVWVTGSRYQVQEWDLRDSGTAPGDTWTWAMYATCIHDSAEEDL